ncbi:MAG: APC family permease [Gammaproteobacteria bacterium]
MNDAPAAGLKKSLKRRHLFTLGVGTIVGVAWLMVLGSVLGTAGPVGAAVGFIIGAGAMIPIGLCYAELTGALPHAGGEVVYAYDLFGIRWAYFAGLCLTFIYVINCVFFAVSVGWLLNEMIPGIQGPTLYSALGAEVHLGDILIGAVGSTVLLAAHWRGARDAARLQDIATYTLLGATIIFVALGIAHGHAANLEPMFAPSDWAWGYGGVFAALAVTPYFFGGFNTIPQAVSELEDPRDRRRIAGVLAGCILTSLLFYCLVLVAVSMALPRQQLLAAELPVAQAFRVVFGAGWVANLVLAAGLLGLVAVWNALFFAATRVLYALGRSHLLPSSLGRLGAGGVAPTRAILVVTLASMVGLFLGKGVLLPVVNVTSTLFAVMYAIVCFGVLRHRRAARVPGAYRVPGGIGVVWTAALFSLYLIGLSLLQQYRDAGSRLPPEWLLLLGFCVVGWISWVSARGSRGALSEAERRHIIFEED